MIPVEDVSGGPCGWCRTTHPAGAVCVTDPLTFPRPTEEETPMSEHVANGCHCEEPLDREPTADLDVLADIYARYLVGGASAEGKEAAQIILDAVPQLVEELQEAREQLAYWRSLPIREEYAITGGRHPDEAGVIWPGSSEDAQRLAQDPDRRPWVRSLTVHPWQDLTEAPF